jgi:hypothetical protein
MITNEGFSSPLKGILDIFYTLFIIENFANRTFVTQKINKELKRVAICAQILALHYRQLPQNAITQEMLPILQQMIEYGFDAQYNLLDQAMFTAIMQTYVSFVTVLCTICLTNIDYLYFSVWDGIPGITRDGLTTIESRFMNLLPQPGNCHVIVTAPVFQQTLAQYDNVITALATMGQATTQLYHNKLYASCRDAENKKEGMVAIMSAYQKYLWNSDDNDRIIMQGVDDTCQYLKDNSTGIIQCLINTDNVFNEPGAVTLFDMLIVIVNNFVALGDILNLGDGNTIGEYTFHDLVSKKLFFVFSWFITSIFGVKTKSKNTKVIALGKTYLELLRGENLEALPEQGALNQTIKLFGCNITIPAAQAVVARARQPLLQVGQVGQMLQVMVDGIPAPLQIAEIGADADGRLCLAYNKDNLRSAISKYIRIDIGNAAIDAAAAAAAAAAELIIAPHRVRALNDVKLVAGTNIISVNPDSRVFKEEIFTQLIIRFSHLRRGNEYIKRAAQYMKAIMRRICFLIDADLILEIPVNMSEILVFYPYGPKPHDVSKFMRLTPDMKTSWFQYLLTNIFTPALGDQTVFDNMKLLVLLYSYIGPLTPDILGRHHAVQSTYLDRIGLLIDENFRQCQTTDAGLVALSERWKMEEPRVIAAAAAAAAAGVAAYNKVMNLKKESLKAPDYNRRHKLYATETTDPDLHAPKPSKSLKYVSDNDAKQAAAAAVTKSLKDTRLLQERIRSGGNHQNRTRRNKNKRKKNSKSKSRKSKSKSKSGKSRRKNVTFKRRKRSNRH